jgi:hypothetical protein
MNLLLQFIPPAVTLIGAFLVWLLSPVHLTVINCGTFEQDTDLSRAKARRKNFWLRVGLLLVVVGAAGQLVVFIVYQG